MYPGSIQIPYTWDKILWTSDQITYTFCYTIEGVLTLWETLHRFYCQINNILYLLYKINITDIEGLFRRNIFFTQGTIKYHPITLSRTACTYLQSFAFNCVLIFDVMQYRMVNLLTSLHSNNCSTGICGSPYIGTAIIWIKKCKTS